LFLSVKNITTSPALIIRRNSIVYQKLNIQKTHAKLFACVLIPPNLKLLIRYRYCVLITLPKRRFVQKTTDKSFCV